MWYNPVRRSITSGKEQMGFLKSYKITKSVADCTCDKEVAIPTQNPKINIWTLSKGGNDTTSNYSTNKPHPKTTRNLDLSKLQPQDNQDYKNLLSFTNNSKSQQGGPEATSLVNILDWWVYFITWRLREHREREQHKERTTLTLLITGFSSVTFEVEGMGNNSIARDIAKIVLRDGRYQSYLALGGPVWLHDRLLRESNGNN
ncbi:hypothetical protein YC2023_052475 [Brassica napus]